MTYWYKAATRGFSLDPVEGAVDISDLEHERLMQGQADGMEIVPDDDGKPMLQSPQIGLPPLDDYKAMLRAMIDAQAEEQRARYITPGSGQAMTYARKADEARRLFAENADSPPPADYPMLAASLGIDGQTLQEVAAVVLQLDAQWAVTGALIEAVRLGAKQAIDMAENIDEARAAFEAASWAQA